MESPTFSQAGANLMQRLPNKVQRNGRKLSANTLRVYAFGIERAARVLGDLPLASINSETVGELIASLRAEEISASSICGILVTVKLVVESVRENGDPLYILKVNKEYACVPIINPEEQRTPCATRGDVEAALQHPELCGPIAIAAGCGLRISEILALQVGDIPDADCYDATQAVLHIRKTLKTASAKRSIPIPQILNAYLKSITADRPCGSLLFTIAKTRLYNLLESRGLPPPHSYRRFFATHHDERGTNINAVKKIMGHSKGGDITARYSKAADKMAFLRSEIEKSPLGFDLPATYRGAEQSPAPFMDDCRSALINLGYRRGEATEAVQRAAGDDFSTRLKRALEILRLPEAKILA
jgi:integrase